MHLDDERIQRLLHGELDAAAKEAATRHAAECARCAQAIEEARREEELVLAALSEADHAAPQASAEMIAARARGLELEKRREQERRGDGHERRREDKRGDAGHGPQRQDHSAREELLPRARFASGWQRRAAAVLITIAVAGAAYAAPGSPLPALLDRIIALVAGAPPANRPAAPALGPDLIAPSPDQPVTSGIAIAPRERFVIRFASAQERGVIAVSLTDGSNIAVRVVGGTATFGTDVEQLTVSNAGSTADYEIELPKSAPWVAIEIGAQRVALKEGARFESAAAADPGGRYLFSLTR